MAINCLGGAFSILSPIVKHQVDVAAVAYALVVRSPTPQIGIMSEFLGDEHFDCQCACDSDRFWMVLYSCSFWAMIFNPRANRVEQKVRIGVPDV